MISEGSKFLKVELFNEFKKYLLIHHNLYMSFTVD